VDDLRHAYPLCPQCGAAMARREEGGIARPACRECGFVQYLNPSPAAAVILRRGDDVCLVKRKFPPKAGQWTLPAGFIEYDEEVAEAAAREALEETGLEVEITGLHAALSGMLPPDRPVLLIVFHGEVVGGVLEAGDDAAEAGWFALDDLPGPIAFSTHRRVLRDLGSLDVPEEKS